LQRSEELAASQSEGAYLSLRWMPEGDSVTAGTVMHRSHLPLTVWFWAAYLMATHSNGMSALQLQNELGLGSYKTAWLLAMKLRLAMVVPGRSPLSGLVEALTRLKFPSAPRTIRLRVVRAAATRANCLLLVPLRSKAERRGSRCLAGHGFV
jgi:hypothetical protein